MIQIKKTILTLVVLLAVTTGAWADETLLTTITGAGSNTNPATSANVSYSTEGVATLTFSEPTLDGQVAYYVSPAWGWWGYAITLTVTPAEGYTITKCVFYDIDNHTATDSEAPFVVETVFDDKTPKVNGTILAYNSKGITKIEVYGYATPSAASGPEVAWDEAKKTGTFTMPGGNVTLEPEYYPQAALTAAPTAINDVPATTDGAIVKAGTVANIGSTETAQGTVMYYVSPTALDDAALLALAADQWTADVPTAEKLAQGEAYVYYYVRGNDSDTDEENFSDGDILAANALLVTIAAEPTYAVTFAVGTQDADKWTVKAGTDGSFQSLPLKGVKAGTKVKLKYDGDRSMLKGVTATSDAKKAAYEHSITIAVDPSTLGAIATAPAMTIEFNTGETWADVAARYDWLDTYETYTVFYKDDKLMGDVHDASGGVTPDKTIDPNGSYHWGM